jgi:glycosyltransferase involved in cell wall biosynthesis
VEDEARLLQDAGHRVRVWNPEPKNIRGAGLVATGLGTVWSRGAAGRVRALIHSLEPDVVHLHNLFPALSPAALRAAAGEKVPVVMTLHNYRLMCLPATLLRDDRACELCVGHVPWRGVVYRCYRDSVLGSGALATSLTLHRAMGTFDRVDLYIAISNFVKRKHVEVGLSPESILVKPHFAWDGPQRKSEGEYFLYVGRFSPEKGTSFLIEMWREVRAPLVVVGDGPEGPRLRRVAPPGVEFRGTVSSAEVPALMAGARALLVPSIGSEAAGKTVLEAYAAGVPVIASAVGALPEVVRPAETGFLLPPGDRAAWRRCIGGLDNKELRRLGGNARRAWESAFSPRQGLEQLVDAYRQAATAFQSRQRV